MTTADERIRSVFIELTDHFMRTHNMGLDAARITAATVMIRKARMGLVGGTSDIDGHIEHQNQPAPMQVP